MTKIRIFLAIMSVFALFNCTEIGESYIDINSDSYVPEMAVDADSNGKADALEYSKDGILNYLDTNYLKAHPELDVALNGERKHNDDPANVPVGNILISVSQLEYTIEEGTAFDPYQDIEFSITDDNDTEFKDQATITGDYDVNKVGKYTLTINFDKLTKEVILNVIEGYTLGEYWLSLNGSKKTITVGDEFNPATDIDFIAKDTEGNDASSDVTFSDDYDVDKEGEYTITLSYEDLTKEFTLVVAEEGSTTGPDDPIDDDTKLLLKNFTVKMSHEYKVNDTLIKIPAGEYIDNPAVTATTKDGGSVTVRIGENGIVGKTAVVGRYQLTRILIDDEDATNSAVYTFTVVVTGPAEVTYSDEVEDEFTVKLGEAYTLPTVTKAVDGEGNELTATMDDGGFDVNTEDTYTVTYTFKDADGNDVPSLTRTLTITVSDIVEVTLTEGGEIISHFVNGEPAIFIIPSGMNKMSIQHTWQADVQYKIGDGTMTSTSADWGESNIDIGGETRITIDPGTAASIQFTWNQN